MDINEIIRQVTEEICAKYGASGVASANDGMDPAGMAKYIDHTYLKPEASLEDIRRICDEAKKYHTASVCVNPSYVKFVAEQLEGSGVTPCCVIAFPFGTSTPEAKAFEASDAASNGAKEVDMVVNIGAIKSGDWKLVKRDIESVVNAVRGRALVKVIIEACLLTDEEKVKVCTVAKLVGADFVKTSTGYSTGGATVACAAAGAQVCHVDAAKGMVNWARENARVSGLSDAPVRWIIDDCAKFVEREIRRGKVYDAIIMDPPSYGRGPGGEVWKLEDNLFPFVKLCAQVLSDKPLFVIINSYTTGLAPSVLGYMLHLLVAEKYGGKVTWDELGLPVTETGLALPCGATGRWFSE